MKTSTLLSFTLVLFVACKKDKKIAPEIKSPVTTAIIAASTDTIPDKSGFKIKLYQDSTTYDETCIIFKRSSSPDYVFSEDAPHLDGFGHVSLANISQDGTDLSISCIPYVPGMNIGLDIHTKSSGLFFLKISGEYSMPVDKQIWLKDNYKKDSVDLRSETCSFEIDEADPNTFGKKRFVLIIK
ncbi:hypothetical protein [Mucilaginibacter ginsenosidivorans]|uniref:Lipoprotein n=1 Tax=Mucilaginibacter ginsenosidivorans TaxID=398053 RepID=A0A5B8UY40_9SPHI|nr:hypothetical protein [Mucilaginibacter ginsenosidivorans]QEC64020.1 hypothetical protein FRZ54_16030 [Mucilaginibacter ginsenosidivorans]